MRPRPTGNVHCLVDRKTTLFNIWPCLRSSDTTRQHGDLKPWQKVQNPVEKVGIPLSCSGAVGYVSIPARPCVPEHCFAAGNTSLCHEAVNCLCGSVIVVPADEAGL